MARCEQQLEHRRQYNREYMRRWRSRPENLAREKMHRQGWYYARKLRSTLEDPDSKPTRHAARPLCLLCRLRRSVCRVQRLVVVEGRPGGFVEISVPYCGVC